MMSKAAGNLVRLGRVLFEMQAEESAEESGLSDAHLREAATLQSELEGVTDVNCWDCVRYVVLVQG